MKKTNYLPLGTAVLVRTELVRTERRDLVYGGTRKTWTPVNANMPGFIVGVRTLSSGTSKYVGHEDGVEWCPSAHHRVYVVAVNLYQRPIFAPIDGVELAVDGG